MKIYLDNCSLQRPLDSKTQTRIVLEAEAVLGILTLLESGKVALVSSEALRFEIDHNPNTIVNTVRFVNQFTTGYGDYTQEREQLFAGMTLDSIVSEIKRKRKPSRSASKEAKPKRTMPTKGVQPTRYAR